MRVAPQGGSHHLPVSVIYLKPAQRRAAEKETRGGEAGDPQDCPRGTFLLFQQEVTTSSASVSSLKGVPGAAGRRWGAVV